MNIEDLKALRVQLIILVTVLSIGGGIIYYLHQQLYVGQQKLAKQLNLLHESQIRVQKSGDEKASIIQYLGDYQSLQQIGFAGDEQRINWLEGLRLTDTQLQLFGTNYQISAQQPYPYSSELDPGQLKLSQSIMKLKMSLLHEGDLMRYLTALANQGIGVFAVNECILSRIETGGSIRYQPNVRAECDLAWITAKPPVP